MVTGITRHTARAVVEDNLALGLERPLSAIAVVTFRADGASSAAARLQRRFNLLGCRMTACASDGAPVLVIASGTNRVDEARVAAVLGQPIGRADADFVREHTGYAIGGVAPVGHPAPIRTLLDRDLLALPEIWAAAGTPNAVFRMTPAQLEALTGGEVADVAKLP